VAVVLETGTWTAGGATPQTITLADGTLTPVAIIVWMVRQGAAAAGFVASQALSIGFGTRRGGATQSGCVGLWSTDAANPSASGRVRNTTLLHVLSAPTATDYTVSLDSFAAGQFTVSYSSAANASGDVFAYMVIGGLDDAIVLNEVMNSVGATEVVTGAGFLGNALLCLDAALNANNTPTTNVALSFGCATSATRFWSVAVAETNGDTMASTMNWNKAARTDACLERLTINADTSDARWDLNTFDSDGFTLGVVDAPTATDQIATFLILKGGAFEAGSKAKSSATGNDTFTLANATLGVEGIILGCIRAATGITTASADMMLGAGSTANTTRGSAVNNAIGIVGPEAIATTADRFSATDSVIEELTGGATPAETSEAWFDTKSTGSFIIDWAVNGGSTNPVFYLAIGNEVLTPLPSTEYPSRLNPALALIAAAHLAFASPSEPPAVPVPDQFPTVFPERVVRLTYPTTEQLPFATDPSSLLFVQDTELVWYPDRLDGRHLATALHPALSILPEQPERTSPLEDVEFPDRLDGRYYQTELQQASVLGEPPPAAFVQDTELVWFPDSFPQPTAPFDQQTFVFVESAFVQDTQLTWFPDGFPQPTAPFDQQTFVFVESAFVQDTQLTWFPDGFVRPSFASQQSFVLGEPFVQEVQLVWFPDGFIRSDPLTQQSFVLGEPAAFVQDTQLTWFPDGFVGPSFLSQHQQAFSLGEPPPFVSDQFSPVFPERVIRLEFSSAEQRSFSIGEPPPFVPDYFSPVFPDQIFRLLFPVSEQLVTVVVIEVVPPVPPTPPTPPPVPPKPPKKKKRFKRPAPQASRARAVFYVPSPISLEILDDLKKHDNLLCEPPPEECAIVVARPLPLTPPPAQQEWQPPSPPAQADPRVMMYAEKAAVDARQQFIENKTTDQRDQRVQNITHNWGLGESRATNSSRDLVIAILGVALALIAVVAVVQLSAASASPTSRGRQAIGSSGRGPGARRARRRAARRRP
jgi:hypothetical protein